MGRIGGDEVRDCGGEDVGSVSHGAAALVYEFQLLTDTGREESGQDETRMLQLRHFKTLVAFSSSENRIYLKVYMSCKWDFT